MPLPQRIATALPDVWILEPAVFADARGFFFESYHEAFWQELGIPTHWVQDNHSHSEQGTLRGLHYQLQFPQAKLCRVVQGEVFDVALDIRQGSPTFGQWAGTILSAHNKRQIYVPRGFAHGFLVLSETADFLYKCDEFYRPGDEHGVAWDDPALGISWNFPEHGIAMPRLSIKDEKNPRLSEVSPQNLPRF